MRLRSRLLAVGVPLMVVPLAASLFLFSLRMADADQAARFRELSAELTLVQDRVEAAWALLVKVGFDKSDFYQKSVSRSIESNLALAESGSGTLLVDRFGQVVLGPAGWKGKSIAVGDPWHRLLDGGEGNLVLASPALTGGQPYLVTYRRFEPWKWVMVTMASQALVVRDVVEGLVLALAGSLVFLVAGVAGFWLLARTATRPLMELQSLASRMGEGRFDLRARVAGPDETVTLAREWNAMAHRVEELTTGLEQKVSERTSELAEALDQTRKMQNQLVLSEKMASLGQLVAGIAHELNTPLGAIVSAQRSLEDAFGGRWAADLETLAALPSDRRSQLLGWLERCNAPPLLTETRTRRAARKDLAGRLEAQGAIDAEEMADSFLEAGLTDLSDEELAVFAGPQGRLLAGTFTNLALARLSARLVGTAVSKADRVVSALRVYSWHGNRREVSRVRVAESIDTVLTLFGNRLRGGIDVLRVIPSDCVVLADAERLSQLWSNLVSNALAAMGTSGRLEIEAAREEGWLVVRFTDSGPGIPADLQGRVFDPFFTTKRAGEGSGLGLSICQTIVQEAGGTLTFTSQPGRTVFVAKFPEDVP